MSPNHETGPRSQEKRFEVENAQELHEKLANKLENRAERPNENRAEKAERARFDVNKNALETDRTNVEKKTTAPSTAHAKPNKQTKETTYKHTMRTVQSEMKAPSRTFSKVIHNPAVEKTSEFVGATIARPNAILAGSLTALILTSALYLIANHFGYVLSGFETIGAFVIGWFIGLIIDYFRVGLLGRRA